MKVYFEDILDSSITFWREIDGSVIPGSKDFDNAVNDALRDICRALGAMDCSVIGYGKTLNSGYYVLYRPISFESFTATGMRKI